MTPIDEFVARREIDTALLNYTRGVDRLDAATLAAAFHPGAMLDGYGRKEHAVEAFAPFAVDALRSAYAATQHRLTNITVEFDGDDAARVESYVVADHLVRSESDDETIHTFAGRYLDRFERRDGRWAITRRSLRRDWTRADPVSGHMPGVFVDSERG